MSSQFLDIVKAQPLGDPVAQAGSPQIVEGAGFDASPLPDLVEVMAGLRQGRPPSLTSHIW
jgi:hypothetical protein